MAGVLLMATVSVGAKKTSLEDELYARNPLTRAPEAYAITWGIKI